MCFLFDIISHKEANDFRQLCILSQGSDVSHSPNVSAYTSVASSLQHVTVHSILLATILL